MGSLFERTVCYEEQDSQFMALTAMSHRDILDR